MKLLKRGEDLEEKCTLPIVTEDDNTNIISFQVEGHTLDARGELHHLTSLDLGQTENTGDTITDRDNSTEFLEVVLLLLNMDEVRVHVKKRSIAE